MPYRLLDEDEELELPPMDVGYEIAPSMPAPVRQPLAAPAKRELTPEEKELAALEYAKKEAEKTSDRERGMAMMQRAAAGIGSAISGAPTDEKFFDQLQASAQQPFARAKEDFEKGQQRFLTRAKTDREIDDAAKNYALKVLGLKRNLSNDEQERDFKERRLAADLEDSAQRRNLQTLQLQAMAGNKEADRELKRELALMAMEGRRETQEAKASESVEKRAQSFATSETGRGINTMEENFANLDRVLGKPLEQVREGEDLPGMNVPGIGRVTLYDDKAKQLQSAASAILNTVIKDRSGAAVTTPEMERIKQEFLSGKWNTEEDFVRGLKQYKEAFRKAAQRTINALGHVKGYLEENEALPPAYRSAPNASRSDDEKRRRLEELRAKRGR